MRWLRREKRVAALRPKLERLYRRPMSREDAYDAALTMIEQVTAGEYRLQPARGRPVPDPWKRAAQA